MQFLQTLVGPLHSASFSSGAVATNQHLERAKVRYLLCTLCKSWTTVTWPPNPAYSSTMYQ